MDMSTEAIKVYQILTGKNFSEDEAIDLIRYMDSAQKEGLATKEDISVLNLKISDVRSELIKWTGGMLAAQAGVIVALIKLL